MEASARARGTVRAVPCSGAARTARASRPDHRDRDGLVEVQNATVGHFRRRLHCEQLRPIEGVARKAEVPDAGDAVVAPIQEDEVCRRSFVASLEHEERRPTVDGAGDDPNGGSIRLLRCGLQLQPIHEVEPNIVGLASA